MSSAAFTIAWLAGEARASKLMPRAFADAEGRRRAVAAAASRTVHPAVLASLRASTPAQQRNLDALARPGTVCVVSGQQAGLFGGPLYTIYKAASVIADARALEAETGAPCVPIFWLQNEDHDYDEIASCRVLGRDGALRTIAVPPRDEDVPGCSIAARRLGPGVDQALAEVAEAVEGLSDAAATVDLLGRCWTAEASPDEAFRGWVEALFARHGLLVFDPRALAAAAAPVHRRAFEDAGPIASILLARTAALEAAGFGAQVHVRRGPLSFFHPEGLDGPRYRIEPVDSGWRLCGTDRIVTDEVVRAGLRDPGDGQSGGAIGRFSTSALLRPILQDHWLPTAAYVGGPGEIAYFAQLPPLYEAFGLPMPMIVPRARFRVVDEGARRLLDQLDLVTEALDQPREALLARIAGRGEHPGAEAAEAALLAPIQAAFADFAPHARALGLDKPAEKTEASVVDAVGRLLARYRRALAESDELAADRLDRLLTRLQPDGIPQERVHAWPWFGARYGEGFVDAVLDAIVPFDGGLKELSP